MLHGTFPNLLAANALEDLTPFVAKLNDRPIVKEFMTLGKLGTDKQYYIPWMQATYVMVANKKALQYLPAGASIDSLTYAQLAEWGKNITAATKEKKIGFPAGPTGLMHRLTQGYLYPSYTGGLVTTYRSDDAVKMWTDFKAIWEYYQSTIDHLQQHAGSAPLRRGMGHHRSHRARGQCFQEQADDFVAAPAPAGPKGRYYMSVLAGLGIMKGTPNRAGAEALIEYLTRPGRAGDPICAKLVSTRFSNPRCPPICRPTCASKRMASSSNPRRQMPRSRCCPLVLAPRAATSTRSCRIP